MSQIHATTQKLALLAVPLPDGKMRVTSQSWDDPLVILPGEALELRCADRQVHASRIKAPVARPAPPDQHEDAATDFKEDLGT